jgi:hypothetical protein
VVQQNLYHGGERYIVRGRSGGSYPLRILQPFGDFNQVAASQTESRDIERFLQARLDRVAQVHNQRVGKRIIKHSSNANQVGLDDTDPKASGYAASRRSNCGGSN